MKHNELFLPGKLLAVAIICATGVGVWHWGKEPKEQKVAVEEGQGAGDLIEPPELVVCFPWADDNIKKGYPVHWGPEPNIQTRDYRKLPEPFGHGSSTLYKWIEANQKKDAESK